MHLHLRFPNADLRTESKPKGDSREDAGRGEEEQNGESSEEKPIKGGHCRQQELNPAGLLRGPVRKYISGGWCPYTPLPISCWLGLLRGDQGLRAATHVDREDSGGQRKTSGKEMFQV